MRKQFQKLVDLALGHSHVFMISLGDNTEQLHPQRLLDQLQRTATGPCRSHSFPPPPPTKSKMEGREGWERNGCLSFSADEICLIPGSEKGLIFPMKLFLTCHRHHLVFPR